jgi:carbamoyl-phosphate synthase large subunit
MARATVFVTGAGALAGQGILRSLRMSHYPMRIITGDPDPRATGHWLGDCAYTIPMAADPLFVSHLERILAREAVTIVLIGTDIELPALSRARERLERTCAARVVVSPPQVVDIADDKWLTARFLADEGFPAPLSALADDRQGLRRLIETVGFPLFVKPRHGARSVGAAIVPDEGALDAVLARGGETVIQELLPDGGGEYTAGCLVIDSQCRATVVLRRDLRDGNTYRAYSEGTTGFEETIGAVAERLGADGPCNLQFRVKDGQPVIFEINARFSGTTPIRAILGFNEVEAIVAHLAEGRPIARPALRQGVVLRAWSDLFVDRGEIEALAAMQRLPHPTGEPVGFSALPLGGDGREINGEYASVLQALRGPRAAANGAEAWSGAH